MNKERIMALLESGMINQEEARKMMELFGIPSDEEGANENRADRNDADRFTEREEEELTDETAEKEGEKRSGQDFMLTVEVESMDIIVKQMDELDAVEYRFVDGDTGEFIPVPEYVDVYYAENRLKITESFYKNLGAKMASVKLGKKMIDMIGLTAIPHPHCEVVVYLPSNKKIAEAKLKTISTGISLDGINTVERIKVSTASGSIGLKKIICDKLQVNTVSGAAVMKSIVANSVRVNGVSGKVRFYGKTPEIDVNTVSGNVRVANDMLLYNSSMNSVSGAINCYIHEAEKQNYSAVGMFKQQKGKGRTNGELGTSLKISTVSGQVKVRDLSDLDV